MTYDQLTAFVAVASEGTFTSASAALHKSQPAVSKLVRNLEDELGLELFDRGAYRATLTEAGRRFYDRATAVIEGTEALKTFGLGLAGRVEPSVRFAIEAVTPLGPILRVLRRLTERYPGVRIELSTERLAGAAEALREDRVDVVVATTLGMESNKVEATRFRRVRIVPVAHREHPLASAGPSIPPASLRAYPQIVLRDSAQSVDAPSINVLEGGLRWTVTDVTAKKEVVLAGLGWGGLPEHVVADAIDAGDLVALEIPEFDANAMELFVHRRRDRAHGVVAQALWDALKESAAPVGVRGRRR
jgi:DNA-binding transcriptional LysR family regulator